MEGLRLNPKAFHADPHTELDRLVRLALADVDAQVAEWRLSDDQLAYASALNSAHAAEVREALRLAALAEAARRGFDLPADHGAPATSGGLATAIPAGCA